MCKEKTAQFRRWAGKSTWADPFGEGRALGRDAELLRDETNRFTPVATWYQSAGAPYYISGFNPHPDPCDPEHTCPGCLQQ